MNTVLLTCCSWPLTINLTLLMCGENLTYPEPEIGGSWVAQREGMELPYYTSGFE